MAEMADILAETRQKLVTEAAWFFDAAESLQETLKLLRVQEVDKSTFYARAAMEEYYGTSVVALMVRVEKGARALAEVNCEFRRELIRLGAEVKS